MQSRDVAHIGQYATNTRQNRSETDDGMESSDHLRQLRRRDASAQQRTDYAPYPCDARKLRQNLRREAYRQEGGENA